MKEKQSVDQNNVNKTKKHTHEIEKEILEYFAILHRLELGIVSRHNLKRQKTTK